MLLYIIVDKKCFRSNLRIISKQLLLQIHQNQNQSMFKLKKIKKKVDKQLKKQYEKLEDRFLGIENTLYSGLEDRLSSLEEKFDRLTELLADKEVATAATNTATSKKKKKKATDSKGTAKKMSKKESKPPKVKPVKTEVEKRIEIAARRDLSKIRGIGKKIADQLRAEGINTFGQIAGLTKKEISAIDEKIPGFAARYERYEWGKQAKDLQ